ncbi:hypothetical protein AQJ43_23760 [Streptomyces avermitilis]|uniref:Uncharacterized protein n=2 Tax=Streptomyces avermitilis TaxID=33903 RepID=Q82C42_STRAW|nr:MULTISPECIES: hypothetical protein [Streptomyces]KUN52244.1 hypothetical protein AQJ43_23760 [Streptomyces avermitilis]MYT01093.1 hypothetical protein [Streptomyces sp. SID5469]OOV30708.1 hypothetical protein SM007_16010 [Streptomyces avermitilis]BAC73224.1 hypothetical protein SAVERM_5512 [Streptomyces avermitilis MA-4680 = NBRC 14893]BBJ53667.1 hypothetical protein SAVMC3_62960 [Streptomyces avermitilis]
MTVPLTSLVFPDTEQMVVNHLLEVLGYEASTVRPDGGAFTEALPFIWVNRIGGVRVTRTSQGRSLHDEARISLDVYATEGANTSSRVAATDAVAQVRAAFEQMHGTSRDGGFVLRTWEETGPAVRPEEPNTNVTRIGLIVGLRVRPV